MERALSPALLSASSEMVAASLGLHFPESRWADLERGIASAAADLGCADAESCMRRLTSSSLTRAEIEILASHLTVGETYFFRESQTLDAFAQHILPELLRHARDQQRPLRIWTAGCCTGEEPYTLAILLDRLLPQSGPHEVSILATDINPRFLRKAAEAVYGEWSFRGTPAPIRERYFRRRRDGRFELEPRIRKRVTFSILNLAADAYPSLLNNTNAIDAIFCRNVLMYFSPERVREVVGNFHRALVPGGWLIVSATETSSTLSAWFSPVQFPGATLYRKGGPVVAAPVEPPPAFFEFEFEAEPIPPPPAVAHVPPDFAAAARRSANEGNLGDAAEWCERAIAADKMNPALHYLLATIRQEQGESDTAAASLMRALYLDHDFVLAHFGLANIELARGRQGQAARHLGNALEALRPHAPDEILPESDGLSAGRLVEIIVSLLESLPS